MYAFHTLWREKTKDGSYTDYAQVFTDRDRDFATRAHQAACDGQWVRPWYHEPFVSELHGPEGRIADHHHLDPPDTDDGLSGVEYARQQWLRFTGRLEERL